ncbi:dephospho-CoA kinase [Selenomonas sp. KH1T6]|uniref:dephospho-CoA kinase n=1 Tax=Selenomonas sp. KH1T6 TaxID=3158784 RepID=UPI0008A72CA0|nr:dephospho-CoA kinase/formamidopyrimidine-DNA glycosylase [Selenomonas ruminantium]
MTRVIGLTGGIASGKSTVSGMLKKLGACIIDADAIAHELAEPGKAVFEAYLAHFGSGVLTAEGRLDRRAVAEQVFSCPEEKQWMDRTAFPLILAEVRRQLAEAKASGGPLIVLDVPLLFEAGWDSLADESWLVYVPESEQLRRLCLRDNCTAEQALGRIRAQMPLAEKLSRADAAIDNSGTIEATRSIVKDLWKERVHEQFA